jgi:DNA invertase Pin-like site-specific DNA recombinase
MERWVDQQGDGEVARIFPDRGKSAKTTNRPALQEMLRWISDHPGEIYAVLVYDFTRAARNVEDHLALRATLASQHVRLISITQPVTEDPHGRFMEVIHAGVAELDNSIRGQRSRLGMQSAAERGRWCHQAPVGYVNCGRNAVPSLRADPERAAVVRAVFTRIADGEPPLTVFEELVESGFGTRRGGTLGRQSFYSMLRNPVYKGQLVTRQWSGDGDWEPIVEPNTWERVQAVVAQTRPRSSSAEARGKSGKRSYRRLREDFELRGWLRCADCGHKLTGGVTKGHGYISCKYGHVRARVDDLNQRFREWLDSVCPNEIFLRQLDIAVRRELDGQKNTLTRRRAEQQSAVRTVEQKVDRVNAALADGTMDRQAYRATYPSLRAELQALQHRGVEDELEQLDVDTMLHFARRLLSKPGRLWADATPEIKIALQRALFAHAPVVDQALNFSTDPNHHDSMTYLLFGQGREDLASPTGTNRTWTTPIATEIRAA